MSLGYHVISGEDLLAMLRRAHQGEDPDLVYAEEYVNAERETVPPAAPWPFGGPTRDGSLPEPAPEVVMEANGVYWRRFTNGGTAVDTLSMVPSSDGNDPVLTPLAVYRLAGWEDHDGIFHPIEEAS